MGYLYLTWSTGQRVRCNFIYALTADVEAERLDVLFTTGWTTFTGVVSFEVREE